jgi:hypothetical protein
MRRFCEIVYDDNSMLISPDDDGAHHGPACRWFRGLIVIL